MSFGIVKIIKLQTINAQNSMYIPNEVFIFVMIKTHFIAYGDGEIIHKTEISEIAKR